MNTEINDADVNAMAGSAEEAASLVDGTAQALSDGGAVGYAGGMDGFATASAVGDVWARWLTKSTACRDSLEYFAEALRATATELSATDTGNAAFVYPPDSPLIATEPPWARPHEVSQDFPLTGGRHVR